MDNIRDTYEAFIKGGGFFICKLLSKRVPALCDNGATFGIPVEYMLTLYCNNDDGESIESIIAAYSEQFSVDSRIKDLYSALEGMCNYLTEIDMGPVSPKYQAVYPEIILKTYGDGIETITGANFSFAPKSGRLSHIRKAAMELLLDLICENDYFEVIDFDFKSEQALTTISFIMDAIKLAKTEDILKDTRKTFANLLHGVNEKRFANNLKELLRTIDAYMGMGEQLDKKSHVTFLPDNRAQIETGTYKLTSKYKLYIDGLHISTETRPSFIVDGNLIRNSKSVRIIPERDIDDWFLLFYRAKNLHIQNQVMDITDASSERFQRFYKAMMLAGGSLKTIKDNANPILYNRIMRELDVKYSRNDMRGCLWPLACIFTVCDYHEMLRIQKDDDCYEHLSSDAKILYKTLKRFFYPGYKKYKYSELKSILKNESSDLRLGEFRKKTLEPLIEEINNHTAMTLKYEINGSIPNEVIKFTISRKLLDIVKNPV